MRVRSDAFFRRLGADGLIGFGEAFMAGDWDADDPAAVLAPFAARMASLVPAWMQRLRHFYVRHQPSSRAQHQGRRPPQHPAPLRPVERAFALFLDETMTYSCARFEPSGDDRCADAQLPQDRPAARRHRRRARQPACSRSAPAGVRSRCGPRSAARPSPRSRSREEQAAVAARACARAPASPTASTCSCATTARSRASTTRS